MTPIIGLFVAVIAAQLAPSVRSLVRSVLALMVAATAVQSWYLGAGLGNNPASTIREVSYWIVQLVIISVMLGVAYGCFTFRARRAQRRGESLVRPTFSGRRGVIATSLIGSAMTVVGIVAGLIVSSMRTTHGTGTGDIPWTGVAGVAIGLVLLIVLGIAFLRDAGAEMGVGRDS